VEIRRAALADLELVAGVLEEAAAWLRSRGIDQWPARFDREVLADQFRRCDWYLGREGARAVGTFNLWREDPEMWGDRPADALYVHRLAVRRSHAGHGGELLTSAERETRAAGRRWLRLDCSALNPGLCGYYERAGFRRAGTRAWRNGWVSGLYEKEV